MATFVWLSLPTLPAKRPVLARGLDYSSEEVYTYVQRIGQQYRAELRRTGGK